MLLPCRGLMITLPLLMPSPPSCFFFAAFALLRHAAADAAFRFRRRHASFHCRCRLLS